MTNAHDRAKSGERDKAFYSASVDYLSGDNIAEFRRHVEQVEVYVERILPRVAGLDAASGPLDILELGAGTCLTSLLVRKRLRRGRFLCADISLARMHALATGVADLVGETAEGLSFLEHDFTFELPIAAASVDLVVFDAALHHSRNIWTTLRECHRVLRPGGAVAALREAYLSPLTFRLALDRLLKSPEVAAGAAENAYLRAQYDYYFRATGFAPIFIPVFPSAKWRALAPFNGLVMSKFNIWACKR